MEIVDSGGVPPEWEPIGPDTSEEAVILSPFDIVTRTPRSVFEIELVFEAYKPAEKRRFGYYTMPVLHGDQLVARLDAKHDGDTLRVTGLWLEPTAGPDFPHALAAGLTTLTHSLNAHHLDLTAIQPSTLHAT